MTALPSEREREKARLARFRDLSGRLTGDAWGLEVEGGVTRVISKRSTGEAVCLCTIHADALAHEYELICSAADAVAFFLILQDRAADAVRALRADLQRFEKKNTPIASLAAMLCQERPFQRFLEEKGAGGPVRDKQAADTRLKSLLSISSKTELNDKGPAQERYFRLMADFRAWKGER
ncbi:hypothetical protein [Rhizobium sp. Leaf386]|uniref:hypothetical protein n=1 Tax=Rhizobium sp. Leaf386 TaxID=1736359 RepID=UPI000712723C|nr:hypothetical protein [Rhizobium sp. Leaf386]KQS90315.1 hypothetical protein ASG50_07620 [Rhizobium sp. Leaf386]